MRQKTGSGASALEIALDAGKSEVVDYLAKKIIEFRVTLNPETIIPPIASFAQLNADIGQKVQKVNALSLHRAKLYVTAKAISTGMASLQEQIVKWQAQLYQQQRELFEVQTKYKQNEQECEDAKRELKPLNISYEENKKKLLELVKLIEAEQKNKHPSSSLSQELLSSMQQQDPKDEQKARMEHFYKKLDKDQLR